MEPPLIRTILPYDPAQTVSLQITPRPRISRLPSIHVAATDLQSQLCTEITRGPYRRSSRRGEMVIEAHSVAGELVVILAALVAGTSGDDTA
jgi:hypothetical protein